MLSLRFLTCDVLQTPPTWLDRGLYVCYRLVQKGGLQYIACLAKQACRLRPGSWCRMPASWKMVHYEGICVAGALR